jgi:S1-C subfamily serine protease
MKILSYRSTMPFDNRGQDGSPSISPTTQKSVMPFNNVPTIQDILEHRINLRDYNPHSGGNWAPGEDIDKSYRETGDDYKRQERDLDILKFMTEPSIKNTQKWNVKIPGGTKTFMSFELARKFVREKNLPFSYIKRVAQNNAVQQEQLRINVIADSLEKTFMVQSINWNQGVQDTGSAFCIAHSYFITCAHVLRSYNKNNNIQKDYFSDSIPSLIYNNRKAETIVIDIDPKLDIALLKCNINAKPLEIDTDIKVGNDIIIIGSPHGYENNVSVGTVGALDKKVYFYDGAPNYMFVDLNVFSGNSGGPVIKVDNGKIIGMVTLIVSKEGSYGLNAALPSSYILDFCRKNKVL